MSTNTLNKRAVTGLSGRSSSADNDSAVAIFHVGGAAANSKTGLRSLHSKVLVHCTMVAEQSQCHSSL